MPTENRSSNTEMVSVPRHWAQETVSAGPGECVSRSDIALLSEALSLPVQQGQAEIVCDTCHGAGEVYTGTMTHHGYNQPPEPDMDTCPECSGEQRWYVASDIDRLVRELDSLLNGDSAARQATLSDIVAQVSASNQVHPEPIAWMVGTAFWWTKEEAERDAAAMGLPVVGLGPMTDQGAVDQLSQIIRDLNDERDELGAEAARLRTQLAERDALLRELADAPPAAMEFRLQQKVKAALSASAEPSAIKQETHAEMRIRHKREFDALDDTGFHYQECRCGTKGSYPLEVKHCVCGKPFASTEPSAPGCLTCNDDGAVGNILDIEPCPDCAAAPPAEIDERAKFEEASEPDGANLDRNSDGDYVNPYVQSSWEGWSMRAVLERKSS